ncbi:LysM peptidoglycan-binding domain-containing protein [Pseudoalteromonas peptidolytica]|uniref:LysM peptidoglycan-binding domain-containing protein n=1 Tax=Pseudoalteromonas peptidolytica TaxID=61150 RepID=UPI00298ECC8B|nr:LysM domain-containing protein [Pseudoalteromonas peptidolytica]MDW7551044.1 LysM domain-containing protein [Pseudoalteromonas peptidolytica]
MKYPIAAIMIASCTVFSVKAEPLTVKADAPQHYVVKKGDTLWDISKMYLRSPWKWKQLWQWNPNIANPDLIYPGDNLKLQYDAHGNPMLILDKGIKKLSPHVRVINQKSTAIPTLPLPMMEPFLRFEQTLSESKFAQSPIVLGADRNVKNASPGHLLYVKADLVKGGHYAIYRRGDTYRALDSNKTLGLEAVLVGSGHVVEQGNMKAGRPAKLHLEVAKQEVRAGDIVLPIASGQSYPAQFSMARPKQQTSGRIIASDNKLREFSTMSVVVLDVGSKAQLKEGNVLDIVRQSPTVIESQHGPRYIEDASRLDKMITQMGSWFGEENDDSSIVWHMPKEKVGEVMVFKVYEDLSYAMVVATSEPIRVGDYVQAFKEKADN